MQSFGWSTCISKCQCSHLDGQLVYPNGQRCLNGSNGSVPWLPGTQNVHTRFLLTWSWCNQNRTRVFGTERQRFVTHRLCVQRSLCMMFVPQEHWTLNFAIQSYRSWPFKQHCPLGYRSWPFKWLHLHLDIEVDHSNKEIASMTNHPNVISISQISKEGFGTYHPPYKAVWKIENKYFNSSSA